ncbi:hypothetical protein [Metabacillus iocasae]|uniref:NADH dehydrogenase subunit 1 n=1 Tax=Priestia iocasae TaxID=2291674 RepID=A0ABS2QU84_9BACI|nr:hypothetical protein [Metabacillus iocasae]MBM7702562.1 hypothetical protein [Metabacillus iocasae]
MIGGYVIDFLLVAIFIIGGTALMGVIANGIGEKFIKGKKQNEHVEHSNRTQLGWRQVGGKPK